VKYLLSFIPSKFKNIIKYFQNLVLGTKSDVDPCFSQSWFRSGIYFLVCYSSMTQPEFGIQNRLESCVVDFSSINYIVVIICDTVASLNG